MKSCRIGAEKPLGSLYCLSVHKQGKAMNNATEAGAEIEILGKSLSHKVPKFINLLKGILILFITYYEMLNIEQLIFQQN